MKLSRLRIDYKISTRRVFPAPFLRLFNINKIVNAYDEQYSSNDERDVIAFVRRKIIFYELVVTRKVNIFGIAAVVFVIDSETGAGI